MAAHDPTGSRVLARALLVVGCLPGPALAAEVVAPVEQGVPRDDDAAAPEAEEEGEPSEPEVPAKDAAAREPEAPPSELPPVPVDVPLEAVKPGAPEAEPDDVRVVRVSTDPLGQGSDADVFRHAAGRATVDRSDIQKRGAVSFAEALSKTPGVRAVEGIAGVGSGATKLNVGVRGANPRLSSSATVLLDEIPLAMAPYGQPELSLFPVSLFAIERIDAVRGGVSVRFGPQTAGGVFNLMTKPIPRAPEASVSTRVDQFGQAIMAAGFGTTVNRFGVYAEYAPQAGRGFLDNSHVHVESGLLKLQYEPTRRVTLGSTSHLYWEDSGLPGGLSVAAYEADRFATTRPDDRFAGWRAGEAVKVGVRPRANQELQLFAYYNHSDRFTRLTNLDARTVRTLTRVYDAIGVEPRWAIRLGEGDEAFVDVTVGVRGALELASLQRVEALQSNPLLVESTGDDDARVGALASYVEQAHHLLGDTLVLRAGVRSELYRTTRRNNLREGPDAVLSQTYLGFVPSASLWLSPREEVSTFLGYARSIGPPSFVQLAAAGAAGRQTSNELADTVETGVKAQDLVGLYGEATGWFRVMQNVRDIGLESVDIVAHRALVGGLETEVGWAPGDLWDSLVGSEIYAGYVYTRSKMIEAGPRTGKELAWYPRHELWAGLAYAFPWPCSFLKGVEGDDDCRALQLGGDVEWSDAQWSDYNNTVMAPPDGSIGLIPAFTLLDAYARFEMLLPRYYAFNLTVGVKNILDTEWFYRTDDVNEGILTQRPRTFYVTLDVKHWFFDAQARAQARRDARRERRRKGMQP
jgi:Fe(3+) dicitrate transport protein